MTSPESIPLNTGSHGSRNKKNFPPQILEAVEITGAGGEGKSIAKVDGMVIFVTGAVPGDVADLQITRKKRRHAEAIVLRLIKASPHRVEPFCQHFGVCGGCKWQHLSYPQQLYYKRQQVIDNLERLGGLELPAVLPILPSPETTFYRNKLEFTGSSGRWFTTDELATMGEISDRNALGFHIPGRFDKVLDIVQCHLQPDPSNAIRLWVRQHAAENELSFYNVREHIGFIRNLTIRTTTTGELMVLLALGHEDEEARIRLLEGLIAEFPQTTSLLWTINPKKNDTIWDLEINGFHGRDHIIQEIPDGLEGAPLKFRIGPKTFFQTNPEQAVNMFRLIRDLAEIDENDLVYDLYCGAGSISLFLAPHARLVIGAEIVPEAIDDAKLNAALNNITNIHFEAGDLKDLLDQDFIARNGTPDVLITDPPRSGMHEDVVMRILEMAPKRIVYVSCNPATQARDLALMKEAYSITVVQPVDMFPHTYHVENLVRLDRR
ncbi:MAG: 23S rRNA (uracil(1939)-C(5))-methyltransferase RlmD [Bacteroidota bacterium]|nr:23S rRNA (uracil(1939)-C(5))-methyltransferase RlmD [Bacteroidota bacterium]